jgi:hypothetical protein
MYRLKVECKILEWSELNQGYLIEMWLIFMLFNETASDDKMMMNGGEGQTKGKLTASGTNTIISDRNTENYI